MKSRLTNKAKKKAKTKKILCAYLPRGLHKNLKVMASSAETSMTNVVIYLIHSCYTNYRKDLKKRI